MNNNEITTCLEAIAADEGVINPEFKSCRGSEKGDNYLGELKVIDVIGKNKTLNLILKTAPTNLELRKQAFIAEAFSNECQFYSKIYPNFQKFQQENHVDTPFSSVCKCYTTNSQDCNEFLIMENLREIGYMMWDRKVPMNKQHVVFALKEYAKLHAISFSMKILQPKRFEALTADICDIFDVYMDDPVKIEAFKVITDKLKIKVDEEFGDDEISQQFGTLCEEWVDFFRIVKNNECNVISHGDCWCNNMLFTYKDENDRSVPSGMKIIDWQIIKMGSPVMDLSHFLYVCTSKDVYDDLDSLLRIYHNTFVEHCVKLGLDRAKVMSFDKLKQDWELFGKYGLVMAFVTLKIMLSDGDESPDLSQAVADGKEMIAAFDFETKHEKLYHKRLFDVVLHCYNNGFL